MTGGPIEAEFRAKREVGRRLPVQTGSQPPVVQVVQAVVNHRDAEAVGIVEPFQNFLVMSSVAFPLSRIALQTDGLRYDGICLA